MHCRIWTRSASICVCVLPVQWFTLSVLSHMTENRWRSGLPTQQHHHTQTSKKKNRKHLWSAKTLKRHVLSHPHTHTHTQGRLLPPNANCSVITSPTKNWVIPLSNCIVSQYLIENVFFHSMYLLKMVKKRTKKTTVGFFSEHIHRKQPEVGFVCHGCVNMQPIYLAKPSLILQPGGWGFEHKVKVHSPWRAPAGQILKLKPVLGSCEGFFSVGDPQRLQLVRWGVCSKQVVTGGTDRYCIPSWHIE